MGRQPEDLREQARVVFCDHEPAEVAAVALQQAALRFQHDLEAVAPGRRGDGQPGHLRGEAGDLRVALGGDPHVGGDLRFKRLEVGHVPLEIGVGGLQFVLIITDRREALGAVLVRGLQELVEAGDFLGGRVQPLLPDGEAVEVELRQQGADRQAARGLVGPRMRG